MAAMRSLVHAPSLDAATALFVGRYHVFTIVGAVRTNHSARLGTVVTMNRFNSEVTLVEVSTTDLRSDRRRWTTAPVYRPSARGRHPGDTSGPGRAQRCGARVRRLAVYRGQCAQSGGRSVKFCCSCLGRVGQLASQGVVSSLNEQSLISANVRVGNALRNFLGSGLSNTDWPPLPGARAGKCTCH